MVETDEEAARSAVEMDEDARPGSYMGLDSNTLSLGSRLYTNLETAPGQVYLTPPLLPANEELARSRSQAVRQARHVERTSELVRAGISKSADLVVGGSLRVSATPDWLALGFKTRKEGIAWAREWSRQAESLFHSWAYDSRLLADSEGHYTFGGMMWQAFRNRKGPDGECAGVIHYDQDRADLYGTPWATHVTIIDPQRIETPPEQALRAGGVAPTDVVDGRLLDPNGRWIGFWAREFDQLPAGAVQRHIFVPREIEGGRAMGFHWFNKTRGAAQRGITDMVNMLRRSLMLDGHDTYALGAAAVAASMATYIKTKRPTKDVAEDLNIAPGSRGAAGTGQLFDLSDMVDDKIDYYKKLNLRSGGNRVPMLDLDDELIIEAASKATADPTAFRNGYLREFASALGLDAESFSGYYGDVNYSSARLALINIMRGVLRERSMFFPAVPSVIFSAVTEEAIVKGRLPLAPSHKSIDDFYLYREAYTRCRWTAPALGWVDPQKEANAAQIRTDPAAPIATLGMEAAAQGVTIDELIEERGEEQQMLVDAGLIENTTDRAAVRTPQGDQMAGDTAAQPRENPRGG